MKKTNLDEMQEQVLLKIEHRGFWIAFFGLAVSIYVQIAIGNDNAASIGGELAILLLLCAYFLIDCIRHGIWDRKLKPTPKTNLLISLATGFVSGIFWFVISYHNYHAPAGSLATFIIMFPSISILVMVLLSTTAAIYKRRQRQLEQQADKEEQDT